MKLVLYASELAAVIGMHTYKSVAEALIEVLKRNYPDVYIKALKRNRVKEMSINTVIDDLKLKDVVKKAIHSKNTDE